MSDLRRREEAVERLNTHYIRCDVCTDGSTFYCAAAEDLRKKIPEIARCGVCGVWREVANGVLPTHALFNVRCDGSGKKAVET